MTERERLGQEAVRESQNHGQDTDQVIDEQELPQPPSQSSEHGPNVDAHVPEQPDVSMPDPDFSGTTGDPVDDDDHDEQPPTEPVPHSNGSHWEWRPGYEVPPEPLGPVSPRRRVVAKIPPTAGEEDEFRQKRMRPETATEFFPLTGEALSEDVIEIVINLFATPTQDRGRVRPLTRREEVSMRNLTREDRDAFTLTHRRISRVG